MELKGTMTVHRVEAENIALSKTEQIRIMSTPGGMTATSMEKGTGMRDLLMPAPSRIAQKGVSGMKGKRLNQPL